MSTSTEPPAEEQYNQLPVPHTIRSTKYTRTLQLSEWTISVTKRPISSTREIDEASARLTIPLPEMIFGNNSVVIAQNDGFKMSFEALEALDKVNKTGEGQLLKVAYSEDWNRKRYNSFGHECLN